MRQSGDEPFELPRNRSARKTVLAALLVSLAVHIPLLLFVPPLLKDHRRLKPTKFDANRAFSLTVVDEDAEKKKKKKKQHEDQLGQFISMPAPEHEKRPDKARFRDRYDSKTDHQMVHHTPGRDNTPGAAGPSHPGARSVTRAQRPQHHPDTIDKTPPIERRPKSTPHRQANAEPSKDKAADQHKKSVDVDQPATAEQGIVSKPNSGKHVNPQKLFPSLQNAPIAMGGGQIDYLKNVPEGDKTLLNRKRSRYWSFMERLKEQVAQQWSPGEEYRRRDPYGKVYGVKDRFTNLEITLNSDGSIRTIYVSKPSGLDFYDKEAVRAVREAGPFLNPPEGMKDEDGLIHISFGFLLDLSTGGLRGLRIFRHGH